MQSSAGVEPARPLAGAVALLGGAMLALVLANSPYAAAYHAFWHHPYALPDGLRWTLQTVINQGLMALFFLAVGLELKQELVHGLLRHPRAMTLPVLAAAAGMLTPALIYHLFNPQGPAATGWAIPMTTDIAFATAVLTLLGPRASRPLLIFLLALAVMDDLGAIGVIATYYTRTLHPWAFVGVAGLLAALVTANIRNVGSLATYLGLGLLLWVATALTGVDPPLAGVLLAAALPTHAPPVVADRVGDARRRSPAVRLEAGLLPVVAYGVMPLFALANAGVTLSPAAFTARPTVTAGVFLGLMLGKVLGVTAAAWLAIRLGAAHQPGGVRFRQLVGAAWLCGIGFTMALFINVLAFPVGADRLAGKLGILMASPLAALIGAVWLATPWVRRVKPKAAGA
ncbi:MAG: Na+/H+ antiporter NhaA [Acidiferrobacter sp.]